MSYDEITRNWPQTSKDAIGVLLQSVLLEIVQNERYEAHNTHNHDVKERYDDAIEKLVPMFKHAFTFVPVTAFTGHPKGTLLCDVCAMRDIVQTFYFHASDMFFPDKRYNWSRVFRTFNRLYNQFLENEKEPFTGVPIPPEKSKLNNRSLVHRYFKNTPLSKLFLVDIGKEPEPVVITDDLPFSGTYILAAQGYGKTTLLKNLVLERIPEECSIIIMDSKGELLEPFRHYPKAKPNTAWIDPSPTLALNPLDLGTHNLDILMYLFSGLLGARFTPLQEQAVRQCVHLTTKVKDANFSTFVDIVTNGAKNHRILVDGMHPREQDFWARYDREYRETKGQILWRLDLLTPADSLARAMFDAPKTSIKISEMMDTNCLTLINNSFAELGEMQSEFFARMFLTMILGAAEQRAKLPNDQKMPVYIFIDEAQTVIHSEPRVADIIYRCRSQKIALCTAHQARAQIKDPLVLSALQDCAIRYVNAKNDAPAVADGMGMKAEDIRRLAVGEFALSLRGQPAQKIHVPLPDFSDLEFYDDQRVQNIKRSFIQRYAYTPTPPSAPPPSEPSGKVW